MLSEADKHTLFRNLCRNRVVLFAGAGFSIEARNMGGGNLPSGGQLSERLWNFLYAPEPYDGKTNLKTLYEAGKTHPKGRAALRHFLYSQLHISGYPDWYDRLTKWFWFRIYTINADDLIETIYDNAPSPRVDLVVAPDHFRERDAFLRSIQLVKLHGSVNSEDKELTFGLTEYGDRASFHDVWYMHVVQDYSTLPTCFVGTQLDEPLFWQYISIRKQRGSGTKERRPKSFLISPDVSKPMEEVLAQFNVVPVRATGREFFEWFDSEFDAPRRENVLRTLDPSLEPAAAASEAGVPQEQVRDIEYFYSLFKKPIVPVNPRERALYLLGSPPTWDDLAMHLDAHRDINSLFRGRLLSAVQNGTADIVVLTSTAGGGKSTIAMRAALDIMGEGYSVFFSEGDARPDPVRLASFLRTLNRQVFLFFDNAGNDLRLIAELYELVRNWPTRPVLVLVLRTNEFAHQSYLFANVQRLENVLVPDLSDPDIEEIIATLDRHHMLGELRAKSQPDRIAVFRSKAKKQILVAMREATSGRGFDEIIKDEFTKLEPPIARLLYLTNAIPSMENYGLSAAQMVSIMELPPNETMNLIEKSLAGIFVEKEGERDRLVIRHPIIAEYVVEQVAPREMLASSFMGFLTAVATALPVGRERRWSRAFRVYRNAINHRRINALFPGRTDLGRRIYEGVKESFVDDGHYWLQYGCYELEFGDALDAAENYIKQAEGIMPQSPQVITASAHLALRKAAVAQTAAAAEQYLQEGLSILRAQMASRPIGLHIYHIFGSQMISYIRRWVPPEQRAERFREAYDELRRALPAPLQGHAELKRLLDDIKRAELETALRPQRR